jgi:hypothetical protein
MRVKPPNARRTNASLPPSASQGDDIEIASLFDAVKTDDLIPGDRTLQFDLIREADGKTPEREAPVAGIALAHTGKPPPPSRISPTA